MVSLSIFAFSSMAISSLMFATYETNQHVKGMADATDEAEITLRRMIEVTRSAVDVQYTNPTTGLYIQTPPDSTNAAYIFIYYLSNGQLREKIENVGSLTVIQDNVVVDSINSFTVTRLNPGVFPESYQVNLILNATPVPISRTVVITGRNLTS